MNEKNLFIEDADASNEENPTHDVATKENDARPNNEANVIPDTASEKKADTEAMPKPKRKYTRKTPLKEDTAPVDTSTEEPQQAKPKRTYTRKTAKDTTDSSETSAANGETKKSTVTRKKKTTSVEKNIGAESSETQQEITAQTIEIKSDDISSEANITELSHNASDANQEQKNAEDSTDSTSLFTDEFTFIPEPNLPIFEIDAQDNANENDTAVDANEMGDEDNQEDEILPPNELFKDRCVEEPTKENFENFTNTEEVEELDSNTLIDEDGQYRFSDFEEHTDTPALKQTVEETSEKYDPKKPRRVDNRFDLLELFVFTLLAVMILTSFFFRHSIVDVESM